MHSMDITTEIKNKVRWHIVTGTMDTDEIITYLKELYAGPDFDYSMKSLWDLRGADFRGITSDGVRSIMQYIVMNREKGGASVMAFVVSQDFDYGMSRMLQIMMQEKTSHQLSIYKDVHEAQRWLEEE